MAVTVFCLAISNELGRKYYMPYFVTDACIGVERASCIEVCPIDCITEIKTKAAINPYECIDCGLCEPVCPVGAIGFAHEDGPDDALGVAVPLKPKQ